MIGFSFLLLIADSEIAFISELYTLRYCVSNELGGYVNEAKCGKVSKRIRSKVC